MPRSLLIAAMLGLAAQAYLADATARAIAPTPIDVDSATPYLGLGINQLSYFDGAHATADLMRESQFRGHDWSEDVGADANGAPTRDFLVIFTSLRLPAGTYKLRFKGRATLGVASQDLNGGPSGAHIASQQYDAATNTTTADVVLPVAVRDNSWLSFTDTRRTAASTRADGVTKVQFWRPGYPTDGSVSFTREFVAAMSKVHVIRGMDFVSANCNPSVTWADRTNMNYLGHVYCKGQPWELLVQLANAANRDIWLNVPVRADDTYIRNLALLLRYGSDGVNPYTRPQANPVYPPLKPGLRVYLEYGNELWNPGPGFYGFGWALELARARMGNTAHPIAYDGALSEEYLALRRWIAYRSAAISLGFRQVFGDAAMMSTVRPVLASQVGNGNVYLSEALKWAEGFYGQVRARPANAVARKVSELWWGAGGAAYYDSTTEPSNASAATMAAYFAGLPNAEFARNTAIDAVWARGYGLKSVAYEGGPGPGGNPNGSASSGAALTATYNADPRMKTRMELAHRAYLANGGQMLVYYVYSGSGPWSFVDDRVPSLVSDTNTVKLQALDSIRGTLKPEPTLGTAVPGSVFLPAAGRAGIQLNEGDTWRYDAQALRLVAGPTAKGKAFSGAALIPVRAAQSRNYQFSLTVYPETNAQVEMLVNGQSAGIWTIAGTCNGICNGAPSTSATLNAVLPAGLNVVRIRPVSNWVWIKNLVVK